ncbi:hypothetical protein KQX54_015319 [Cotesia glomerata]|uniref:Uncharacterized protein n=1 Tax=Cotesia glomerata TaxID=32391 RepID=A0AAV7IVY0_COTGL|nr:hypothetical protein KQX54_015319 [Cotesia glomerata]
MGVGNVTMPGNVHYHVQCLHERLSCQPESTHQHTCKSDGKHLVSTEVKKVTQLLIKSLLTDEMISECPKLSPPSCDNWIPRGFAWNPDALLASPPTRNAKFDTQTHIDRDGGKGIHQLTTHSPANRLQTTLPEG